MGERERLNRQAKKVWAAVDQKGLEGILAGSEQSATKRDWTARLADCMSGQQTIGQSSQTNRGTEQQAIKVTKQSAMKVTILSTASQCKWETERS